MTTDGRGWSGCFEIRKGRRQNGPLITKKHFSAPSIQKQPPATAVVFGVRRRPTGLGFLFWVSAFKFWTSVDGAPPGATQKLHGSWGSCPAELLTISSVIFRRA